MVAKTSSDRRPREQLWLLVPIALSSLGVNLLVGTENGLMLLDRSGQGKVYNLINRRRFQQMDVLEGLNVLVTISGTPLVLSPQHSPSWPYTPSSSSSDKTCSPVSEGSSQGSGWWFIPESKASALQECLQELRFIFSLAGEGRCQDTGRSPSKAGSHGLRGQRALLLGLFGSRQGSHEPWLQGSSSDHGVLRVPRAS